jgi:hypothetical protein
MLVTLIVILILMCICRMLSFSCSVCMV